MRHNNPFAVRVNTHELCEYGCGQRAIYKFKHGEGKACCSRHYNSCPGKRKQFSDTQDHKSNAAKSLKTRTDLGITKSSQIKGGKTRRENGHYERLSVRMREILAVRSWNTNPKWGYYKDTEIMQQSSLEHKFLQELEDEFGLQWVSENVTRGPCFHYYDPTAGKERLYISDFKISNTIFEIKGDYTWNRCGKDKGLEETNMAKLTAVKEANYNAVLVLEGKRIEI